MAYNTKLADRVRGYLESKTTLQVEEKEMFRGLAFLINGKMCVNVSGDKLMCRFDPQLENEVVEKSGFEPMIMKGKQLHGYCYVNEEGYKSNANFTYWLELCLDFNDKAKASKKKRTKKTLASLPKNQRPPKLKL